MELIRQYLPIYFLIICVIGFLLMSYDKLAAKILTRHRIPEKTLMTVGALGGALAMIAVMLMIRHKTKKPLFYIGLPLEVVIHVILAVLIYLL